MGHGERSHLSAALAANHKRASILYTTGASGGIAHMADATARFRQALARIREDLAHLAHFDAARDLPIVGIDGHARALLAAMLQRGQGQGEIASYIDLLVVPRR